jgi:eukaryotic-like serine/threonine-protein kinase
MLLFSPFTLSHHLAHFTPNDNRGETDGVYMNYGRYQIVKEVGRGSMGVVYEALDPNIDRIVALKVLRQDRITSETFVKRFLKEARVIGRLSHPNIVTIYDVGEDQETVYIAMEFLHGVTLSDFIKDKRLDAQEVVELGTQIAETLDYAHQKGVIHRDIKPSNIVVQPDSRIKITDFGIAHIDDASSTTQTQAGDILGTPAYMSPEQLQGQAIDGRSDIFSLGVILYELSTGHSPFGKGKGLATVFNEIMELTPEEPFKASPLIPHKLSDIIMKALNKEPDARFQSGWEMADALRQSLVQDQPVTHPTPTLTPAANTYVKPAIVVAILSVITVGFFFFSQYQKLLFPKKPLQQFIAKPLKPRVLSSSPPSPPTIYDTKAIPKKLPEKPITVPPPQPVRPAPLLTPTPPATPSLQPAAELPIPRQLPAPTTPKPLPKFAFLKIKSSPDGAEVYINGEKQGITPIEMKIGLGEYKVRISSPGYHDSEHNLKLDKMTAFPLTVKLKQIK